MGVLMESSQANIHPRAEQTNKPMEYYIVDKCNDRIPPKEVPLALTKRDYAGDPSAPEVPKRGLYDERNPGAMKYFPLPPGYWNWEPSLRYLHHGTQNQYPKERWPSYNNTIATIESSSVANGQTVHDVPVDSEDKKDSPKRPSSPSSMPPPKKKWIKNYMEEEPSCLQLTAPRNGIRIGPPPASAPIPVPNASAYGGHPSPVLSALPALLSESCSDLPRARSNSNSSIGPRAGTREVHNKLEKNRRAHLKECFETLRLQLPASADDKKSSNLSILDSAIKYILALKRRERDLEHEMEKLAREKILFQQKLSSLSRDIPTSLLQNTPTNHDRESAMEVEETMSSRISPMILNASPNSSILTSSNNGDLLSTSRTSPLTRLSPPVQSSTNVTLDLTTRSSRSTAAQVIGLHTSGNPLYNHIGTPPSNSLPTVQRTQIIGSFSHIPNGIVPNSKTLNLAMNSSAQNIRGHKVTNVASSLPTLTVTAVNPNNSMSQSQSLKQGQLNGRATQSLDAKMISSVVTSGVNGQTAIVHPAQIQLSQVMNGGSLVMSPTIQLISTTQQGLRVLQNQASSLTSIDLPTSASNGPIQRMRDAQKTGEMSPSVTIANGAMRALNEQHHIAIKPQPTSNTNASLRSANSQSLTHVMNAITPLVVSQGGTHIMTTSPHIGGKVVGGSLVKTGVNQHIPLTVNTQYLGAATIVKPVVVVSTSNGVPPTSSS